MSVCAVSHLWYIHPLWSSGSVKNACCTSSYSRSSASLDRSETLGSTFVRECHAL